MGGELRVEALPAATRDRSFRERWEEVAREAGDVYYRLAYLEAAAVHEPSIFLALYSSGDGVVAYPFVLRPLAPLPFARNAVGAEGDVVTPYEYGGPISIPARSPDARRLMAAFQETLLAEYAEMGVVSEFVRFHPLLGNHVGLEGIYDLRASCENVVVDLRQSRDEVIARYSRSQRRNIRLAAERGVGIERADDAPGRIKEFLALYEQTMERRTATEYYYFSADYFEAIAQMGREHASLYLARGPDGRAVCAAFIVHGPRFAHYHLSGTAPGVRRLYANNLLLHQAALDMKEEGRSFFHLGGAAGNQSGLMDFKGSFSEERRTYVVGQRVTSPAAYEALCNDWARARPGTATASPDYFPLYRYGG